jgi:glycosyltransferase involved in cell wall biosynthesis
MSALNEIGVEAEMVVDHQVTPHPQVVRLPSTVRLIKEAQRYAARKWLDWRYPKRSDAYFSLSPRPDFSAATIKARGADVLHLHWVGNAFLALNTVRKSGLPAVWTMHDMAPFTGGCHYDGGCGRYTASCGQCPQLGSDWDEDASFRELHRKGRDIPKQRLVVVSPSKWLADCARASSLMRDADVRVIPYGINISNFQPRSKAECRRKLGLPLDRPVILVGAFGGTNDPRKGYREIGVKLAETVSAWRDHRPEIALFGHASKADWLKAYRVHNLGLFQDERELSEVYSAADVFLAPSRQDNLPNTIMESLACGTPVVSFRLGGIPDMIESGKNGYLAAAGDADDFVRGIFWLLQDGSRLQSLSENSRMTVVQKFSDRLQAERYRRIYEEILAKK